MGRGNDAIPTWSGFNYQGKMMLLYVLELINKIQKNNDTKVYKVELERIEDFCIICNGQYKSFHQVKAYLSTSKWDGYSEAMDKLLQHRTDMNATIAKCYLIVAKEIKDWNDKSNTYNTEIQLYKRSSKVVGVCAVGEEIHKEILEYLKHNGHPCDVAEVVYAELCLFLDDCIAKMHSQRFKSRNYIIEFSEIIQVIESAVKQQDIQKEFYYKEQIYEYVMGNIEKALEGVCQNKCGNSLDNCDKICAARTGYEKILEISNYSRFCKVLNPSKIEGWDNEAAVAGYLPIDKLQSEIYELLYQSNTPDKVIGDSSCLYLQTKYSQAPKKQVLPTFLNLRNGRKNEQALQRIFQNIINNTDVIDILEGNSITVIPGDYMGILSQAQITSGWKSIDKRNINNYYGEIEFISIKDLKEQFEQNGGNHD